MRRILLCALAAALGFAPAGCKRRKAAPGPLLEKSASVRKATSIRMGDPANAGQLVNGFHSIEDGAWRWTGKQFTVVLGAPVGAAANGATLSFAFTVPPVTIEKLHSITLSASAGGAALAPETYTAPGQYTYRRDIPASALHTGSVDLVFQLDKALPPAGADARELGVVAVSAALEGK